MNRWRALLAIGVTAGVCACSTSSRSAPDPGSFDADPASSVQPPASMAEVAIDSGGARLNGLVYVAPGPGRHPVVVFLHGYPGNEKNLDLAQAVRRAGYQAIYVDYRGTWGSGGTFSFANALEDADATLAWVRTPENASKYHFDVERIAIVGHSLGGWVALLTAARQPRSVCIAGLAAWNVGGAAQRFATHQDERSANLRDFRASTDPAGGPVRGNADALLGEMVAHADDWDYRRQASHVGDRALLLVAATNDSPDEDVTMHEELAHAVRTAGNPHLSLTQYEDDHPFSSHRVALAGRLTAWLDGDCAATQR